jgi:serralysin
MKFVVVAVVSISTTFFFPMESCDAYQLSSRWSSTTLSGGGLGQGDPTTITWSIVPDGTNIPGEGSSNLVSFLNFEFGSSATWLPLFTQSFQRWDDLSGLTLMYESNDDGVSHGNFPGLWGTRGDVRIGGNFLDGSSGVLAYNFFPNNGDMVLDTGDGNFYDTPTNNFRALRNVLMHEHGHGIGIRHVESNNSRQLMEPFINTNFDGPQFDDLLAVQRHYGDIYEENGGNNSSSEATSLGAIADGSTASIGTDAINSPAIASSRVDFVSVDDNSDSDYYSFTVSSRSELDILLDPRGPTYNQGPQGGGQNSFNTRALSNLRLRLYDTNGTTLLSDQSANGIGSSESIDNFVVDSGTYFVRVTGAANNVQMYRLDVTADNAALPGDFDDDGDYACADVDALVAAVASGSSDLQFDLSGNGSVGTEDVTEWLAIAGAAEIPSGNPYLPGDANLSGVVDFLDFNIWAANRFTSQAAWCLGDFNATGVIDFLDFNIWAANRFQSSLVPEPSAGVMICLAAMGFLARRRRG